MKLFVLSAVIGATLLGALPASAQIVIRDRDDAVVVRHMDRGRHEGWNRGRHEGWRNHHADCRVVRVRTRLANGDVIVRSRRTCD
jgi:Ni/Co efflux regulator RcnB